MTKPTKIARGIQAVRAEGEPTEVAAIITQLTGAFAEFRARHTGEVDELRKAVDQANTQIAAFQMGAGPDTASPAADLDGGGIKVLRTPADFRAHYASRRDGDDKPRAAETTLTDFMRGVAGMSSTEAVMASLAVGTDSAGGYVVPDVVMPGILSALVPASSLLQAGAGIVPMGYGAKSVSTAAIDTLPTATWRNELGNISESEPTLRSVQSTPRSLACIVRVSRELLADGSDVDRALRQVNIGSLGKEDRADLLNLPQGQSFHPYFKQFYLNTFPLPAFLFFTVVELDFLHAGDYLYNITLFSGGLSETFVIQFAAILHKEQYPYHIQGIACNKDTENNQIVISQYKSKHKEIDERKKCADGIAGKERLNASVVADALHDISCHFRIEIAEWQFHQFCQKVGNQGNVYPRVHV